MSQMSQPQDDHMTQQEAIESIVESMETASASLGPIGDFFETLDQALRDFPDDERITPAAFLRAYKKAVIDLEAESKELGE